MLFFSRIRKLFGVSRVANVSKALRAVARGSLYPDNQFFGLEVTSGACALFDFLDELH